MRRVACAIASSSRVVSPAVRGCPRRTLITPSRLDLAGSAGHAGAPPPPPPPPPPSAASAPPPPPPPRPPPQAATAAAPPNAPPKAPTAPQPTRMTPTAAPARTPPSPPPPLPAPSAPHRKSTRPPRMQPPKQPPRGKAASTQRGKLAQKGSATTAQHQRASSSPTSVNKRAPRTPPTRPLAPPPPPPAPAAPSLPLSASAATATYTTIAPPKLDMRHTTEEGDRDVASALHPSFAASVEAAVLHACDTTPTRRVAAVNGSVAGPKDSREAVQDEPIQEKPAQPTPSVAVTEAEIVAEAFEPRDTQAPEAVERAPDDERAPNPSQLPSALQSSLDNHEIPSNMGGDEEAAEAPVEVVTAAPSGGGAPGAAEEKKPFTVWQGWRSSSPGVDRTVSYVRLDTTLGGSNHGTHPHVRRVATLQLVERPPSALALLEDILRGLDDVDKWIAQTPQSTPDESGAGTRTPSHIVRLTSSAHVPFFAAAQHPLELSTSELASFYSLRDAVLSRLSHPTTPGLLFEAVATGAVNDFAAELFFVCSTRTLASLTADTTVGFPALSLGLFPSFYTVNRLRQLQGVLFCVENVPKLHDYDVSSLVEVGLASALSGTAADTAKEPTPSERAERPRSAPGWGAWLEDYAMSHLCRSASTRRAAMHYCLLPRTFTCTPTKLEGPFSVSPAWREYMVLASTHCDQSRSGAAACRSYAAQLRAGAPHVAAVHEIAGPSSEVHCHSRRLVRHAVMTQRRRVAPLASPLFLTFRPDEASQWENKLNALVDALPVQGVGNCTTATGGDGATVVLDVSTHALPATLALLEKLTAAGLHNSDSVRLLLLGDADRGARAVLTQVPCAAVISTVSPFTVTPFAASLQQVRLFARSDWPSDLQHDTLAAAVTYLQHVSTPYVLCATPVSQRVVVAFLGEALRMQATTPAVSEAQLERAAVKILGLYCSPTTLLGIYGGPTALVNTIKMIRASGVTPRAEAADDLLAVEAALRSTQVKFTRDVASSSDSCATTFSRHSAPRHGTTGLPSATMGGAVDGTDSVASDAEVAQRLLAVVVNCLCDLLDEGAILSPNDANLISVSALGFSENTGGALALADLTGLDTMVEEMKQLASRHGSHLAPHPLLMQMVRARHTFASAAAEAETA